VLNSLVNGDSAFSNGRTNGHKDLASPKDKNEDSDEDEDKDDEGGHVEPGAPEGNSALAEGKILAKIPCSCKKEEEEKAKEEKERRSWYHQGTDFTSTSTYFEFFSRWSISRG
jgi:hypothetical protein